MASPTHSQLNSSGSSGEASSGSSLLELFTNGIQSEKPVTNCNICQETYIVPKVLPCLHTFCQACLEKLCFSLEKIQCPLCMQDCILPPDGISGLLSDYAVNNCLENAENLDEESKLLVCTGCKNKDAYAVARCYDCDNYLCGNCVTAHQYMHCFEGHKVISFRESVKSDFKMDKLLCCPQHLEEKLMYFCLTCNVPVCKECINASHPKELHEFDHISKIGPKQVGNLAELFEQSKTKVNNLKSISQTIEQKSTVLQMQLSKSKAEVNSTFKFYYSVLEERKQELLKELNDVYNARMISLSFLKIRIKEMVEKMLQLSIFVERIMRFSSDTEILMFKQLLDTKLQTVLAYNPEMNLQPMEFEFISNYQAILIGVKNTFGYIRQLEDQNNHIKPIARPITSVSFNQACHNGHIFEPNIMPIELNETNHFGQFSPDSVDFSQYEKWSSDTNDIFQNGIETFHCNVEPTSNRFSMYPLKSDIKRQKMVYTCKFGEFGIMDGQFTEPSGVAVNAQNDIVVADANNCRIQVFDKEGRFKFQFGECGKGNGKLLYPNRVAVVKPSGDIIVTERSPVHQIQIYNQYGQFVRRFGANVLQHPRGVTVDNKGRIIIIECKVMRIIIFDQLGNVLQKFGCAKHLSFPNGIVTNNNQEIFVSDNRAHCVKVFNYEGIFLRNIGSEGITNYPIGVCINKAGEILVADNHNNFNVTVFTQDGQLVSAFESKVKHEQCYDVAIVDDTNVVLTCKDYRVYVYSYLPCSGITF